MSSTPRTARRSPLGVNSGDHVLYAGVERVIDAVRLDRTAQVATLAMGDESTTVAFDGAVDLVLCPHAFTDDMHCTMRAGHETGHYRDHTRPYLREGWAAGSTDGGEWLTVWGSAYAHDLIYATREGAEERADDLRARSVPTEAARVVVAQVRRTDGGHYRITVPVTA